MPNDSDAPDPHSPVSVYRFAQDGTRTLNGLENVPVFILRRVAGPFTDHAKAYEERDRLAMVEFLESYTALPDRGEVYHL